MWRILVTGTIVVATVLAGTLPAAAVAPPPPAPAPPAPTDCPHGSDVQASTGSVGEEDERPGPTAGNGTARTGSATASVDQPCEQEPGRSAGYETSAAAIHGWGEPNRVEEFDGPLGDSWNVYDGPGHAGNGRRTPDAVSIENGIMTITGDSRGNTAGMAWNPGQKYGRWEGRVKAPASDESYNALLLLWPDAEDFPVGGEIDFMEMLDHTRQKTNIFLHYGEDNDQVSGQVRIDATQWHNWAVEWTPTHVAAFVDGKEWWRTTDVDILPPRPMHLCVQLDWFPRDGRGEVQESYMLVDWVKQYPLRPEDLGENATEEDRRAVQEAAEGAPAGPAPAPHVRSGAETRAQSGTGSVGGAPSGPAQGPVQGTTQGTAQGTAPDSGGRPAAGPVASPVPPLTEGGPDPAPVRRGLVERAVRSGG